MYDEVLQEDARVRLMKSFVYAEHENFCAHAVCLGVLENQLNKRIVPVEGGRQMSIYTLKKDFCKKLRNSGELCWVCSRDGYLSATIRGVGEEHHESKAHLLCALTCSSLLLEDTKELQFRLQSDSNNSTSRVCSYCSNEVRTDDWLCEEKECDKACHLYCYYKDRKEKILDRDDESNQHQFLLTEEIANPKPPFRHWYRKTRVGECFLEVEDYKMDITVEDISEICRISDNPTFLNQLELTTNIILDKVKEIALPKKPACITGLGCNQESFCDNHAVMLSSYCNCRENKEKLDPEEIQSIFCEDCGLWFHKPCVRCTNPGGQPRGAFVGQLAVPQVLRAQLRNTQLRVLLERAL
jgi:hypothetical protein